MARMGTRSRLCLESVDPTFGSTVRDALLAAPDWLDFGAISGKRSLQQQMELFAKGRDEDGVIIAPSAVVTYRDGLTTPSRHQSGMALDIMAYKGGRGTFDEGATVRRALYIIGFAAARGVELTGGVKWGWDFGHLEVA